MTHASILAGLLCTACATQPVAPDPVTLPEPSPSATVPAPIRYTTQREAPISSYAVPATPTLPRGEMRREPTARPSADAKAVGQTWIERLTKAGVLGGYGLSGKREDDPVSSISVLMTARDFDAWLAREGWTAPRHIAWSFSHQLFHPRTTPEALAKVRVWPASQTRTGVQNMAALGGRIILEDGCFIIERGADWGYAPPGRYLVWFGAETRLVLDDQGYLALMNRADGTLRARIAEDMRWAGPNGPPRDEEAGVAELRAACGTLPIEFVGNVESATRFNARLRR